MKPKPDRQWSNCKNGYCNHRKKDDPIGNIDWSYIHGGIGSGTTLIRPDYSEMLNCPFLWQQTEYCLGRPTSDFVFLVLAAQSVLKQ